MYKINTFKIIIFYAASKVVWPLKPVPSQENPLGIPSNLSSILPKYTTVFGIPVFAGAEITVIK